MKKIILAFAGVACLAMLFAPLYIFAANNDASVIETENTSIKTDSAPEKSVSGEPVSIKTAEYILPYPGILPDHPLYFIKQIRDRIMESLISDPIRKIEFYILQGDKLTNSGIFLNAKNKETIAAEVFSRASKSMEKAIKAATFMIAQGKVIPGYITDRLDNSLAKQEEVLTELADKATDPQKSRFVNLLETVKGLRLEAGRTR
jgi:hypothetical protein